MAALNAKRLGVRPVCRRFPFGRGIQSGSKLRALQTLARGSGALDFREGCLFDEEVSLRMGGHSSRSCPACGTGQ